MIINIYIYKKKKKKKKDFFNLNMYSIIYLLYIL